MPVWFRAAPERERKKREQWRMNIGIMLFCVDGGALSLSLSLSLSLLPIVVFAYLNIGESAGHAHRWRILGRREKQYFLSSKSKSGGGIVHRNKINCLTSMGGS